jgi:transposase
MERELPQHRFSTATRRHTGPAAKSDGSGRWWRRRSSSIRSLFLAGQKSWCNCRGRFSPVSFAATAIPVIWKYHKGSGQFCWAHFKRNILGVQKIAKTTDAERFCRDALALHARLFRLWHRFGAEPEVRYGPVTRQELIRKSVPLEKKFAALALRFVDSEDKDVRNLATALLTNFARFLTFLVQEGVEPTNNSAERALRCAVQWCKTSLGSRSPAGEIAVARLLTVTCTCRMQNRKPLGYLATAIRSHRKAEPCTSLLKTDATT